MEKRNNIGKLESVTDYTAHTFWRLPSCFTDPAQSNYLSTCNIAPWKSRCMTPRVVRQKNMVMSPVWPRTKNDCAGEGQQQFTRPDLPKYSHGIVYTFHKDIKFVTKTTNANYSYRSPYGCYGYLFWKWQKYLFSEDPLYTSSQELKIRWR
jgi:hypothetical protein